MRKLKTIVTKEDIKSYHYQYGSSIILCILRDRGFPVLGVVSLYPNRLEYDWTIEKDLHDNYLVMAIEKKMEKENHEKSKRVCNTSWLQSLQMWQSCLKAWQNFKDKLKKKKWWWSRC